MRKAELEMSMSQRQDLFFLSIWLTAGKTSAPGEDRTHDLQMARLNVIMRLTRYLLRYRGTKIKAFLKWWKNVDSGLNFH